MNKIIFILCISLFITGVYLTNEYLTNEPKMITMPQEGFCDETNNGPFCVERGSYTIESNMGYGHFLLGVSFIILSVIISYKLYKTKKKKSP